MQRSEIITAIIAVYGAVLSTIAITRQWLSDRVKIKMTALKNRQIIGDPLLKDMTLTVVEVVNVGRRPVTIMSMGAIRLYPARTNFVAVDTKPQLPCEITEGQYVTNVWDQDELDLSSIDYWAAWDSHGRMHQLREASRFQHWKSALQRKWAGQKYKQAAPFPRNRI
jgi:hypothetical protein